MTIKQLLGQITPDFIKTKVRLVVKNNDLKKFNRLEKLECDTRNLLPENKIVLKDIFESEAANNSWNKVEKEIDLFNIIDGTGGVNKGDRRAIYHLIRKFKPKSVLEIGTHIGASTIHIASALVDNGDTDAKEIRFKTLDIRDVNSTILKPWLQHGMKHSPLEMVQKMNYEAFVNFDVGNSTDFLRNTKERYDFIFLDGNHFIETTYKEIPAALKLLNPNGIILLHDYFPEMKPLWSNNIVLDGTYLATKRLMDENKDLTVLPLGSLPWRTKLDSNVTSLALLAKK